MASKVKIRTAHDDDYVDPGVRFVDVNGDPEKSLTVQSEIDNCDINVVVARFEKTGLLPIMSSSPIFGDFTNVPDYRDAIHIVRQAEDMFMSLDAKVRKEFDNDPAKFLEFCGDPKNGDRLVELGLRKLVEAAPSAPQGAGEGVASTSPEGGK